VDINPPPVLIYKRFHFYFKKENARTLWRFEDIPRYFEK
jgi:hypothetical protein